jgi:hypothetical protein
MTGAYRVMVDFELGTLNFEPTGTLWHGTCNSECGQLNEVS